MKTLESIWTGSATPYSDMLQAIDDNHYALEEVLSFLTKRVQANARLFRYSELLAYAAAETQFCKEQGI